MEGPLSPFSAEPWRNSPHFPPSSDSTPLVKTLQVLPVMHRTPRQSQSFPEQQTSVLSQQQTSVLSQQKTSVLFQQQTSLLLQEQTMSSVTRTGICLVSTHNVDVSEVSIVAMSQCSSLRWSVWPQIGENAPKWVQNGRQVMRLDPWACRGHFLASWTGPVPPNRQNIVQTPDQPPPAAGMLHQRVTRLH